MAANCIQNGIAEKITTDLLMKIVNGNFQSSVSLSSISDVFGSYF